MKLRYLFVLTILSLLLYPVNTKAAPSPGVPIKLVDKQVNPTQDVWLPAQVVNTDTERGNDMAMPVNSYLRAWYAAALRWVRLQVDASGGLMVSIVSPVLAYNASFATALLGVRTLAGMYAYDTDAALMARVEYIKASDAVAKDQKGLPELALNLFYDTTGGTDAYRRWTGAAMADAVTGVPAPYVQGFNMIFDTVAGKWDRASEHAAGDALDAAQKGQDVISYTHWYNGTSTKEQRWSGLTIADALTTPATPFVGSFGLIYDTVATKWNMLSQHAAGDGLAKDMKAADTLSYNLFYDTTLGADAYRRWTGAAMADDITSVPAPYVQGFNMVFDTVAGKWDRVSQHAAGDALAGAQPGIDTISYTHWFDYGGGGAEKRWSGSTLGDDIAGVTVPYVGSFNMIFDTVAGKWDMVSRHAAGDSLDPVQQGEDVISYTHYFDSTDTKEQRWTGSVLADALTTPQAPYVGNFNLVYDTVAGKWNMMPEHAAGDALDPVQKGIDTVSYTHYFDSTDTKEQRWTGAVLADALTTPQVPFVGSFGLVYDTVAGKWNMTSQHAAGDALAKDMKAADTLSYNLFYDTTGGTDAYRRWSGAAVADATTGVPAPYTQNFNLVYDTVAGKWNMMPEHAAGDALDPVQKGIDTISYTHWFDATDTKEQRWAGAVLADALTTPQVPFVGSFGLIYDTVAGKWNMASQHAAGDALAADMKAADTLSYNLWHDTTGGVDKYKRWYGAILADGTGSAILPAAPYVGAFGMVYDGTNNHWDKIKGDASGNLYVTNTTSIPMNGRIQDGDSTVLADVEDTSADGKATTLNTLMTGATMYLYNGATLDMARSGPNKETLVYVNNWPDAFDAANARVNSYKVGSKEYNPPMEGPTAVVGALIDVLAAKQVINWPNFCIWVKNVGGGGAGPLTDAAVLVSPDNTNWVSLTWIDCDGLTSGNTCVYCVNTHSYNWVKVQAKAAAAVNDTTVSTWLTTNAN